MAFRSTSYLKGMVSGLRAGSATYATSSSPKLKTYAPAADYAQLYDHQYQHSTTKPKPVKGDFVPVYVAIGMIALSVGLGLHTATHHLARNPSVFVSKKRRETIPEVVEPEHVAEEAEQFIRKSFFRKVAHVQEFNNPEKQVIPDPIRKDAYAHRPRLETLKSVRVEPN
ncbi:uncharacterized protein LOC133875830 [Alnus glutinosa]|uniref:uncharacterized protein LOC133875830 n=1 Tax=Alnus glutinosa TaxID=3517 RepID=UPI002D775FCC|nr:uncharacterized protein LOC133875830 [Alnus glutinosa]